MIRSGGHLDVGTSHVASAEVLPSFYEARNFEPAWTDPGDRTQLLRAIDRAAEDGLSPADYHRAALLALNGELGSGRAGPDRAARADLLFTDALVRLGYHIILGKVSPKDLEPTWNLEGNLGGLDPVKAIEDALASGSLEAVIESYKPQDPFYVSLKAELARYRQIAAAGGWPTVPEIGKLEVGDTHDALPTLRRRLAITGHLAEGASMTSTTFDESLVEAVRDFQRKHGLNDDGIVGRHTLEVVNVSPQQRVDQIRVNLERGRWILRDLGDDFIAVNIASFYAYVVRDRQPIFSSRVVVGKLNHKSPVFRADMKYIVLNPTWVVPASIARGELLPDLRKNPNYLSEKHITLLDRSGNSVDPVALDLTPGAPFPYTFRQEPGAWNALGQIKFIFPNPYSIYLHDSPSRNLFDREVRAFSHGCIRVGNPLGLAEVVLSQDEGWDRPHIDEVLASGKTTTVYLDEPLPVLILYWTAWVNPDGELKFYDDIYSRDRTVLEALDREYQASM
ncbi:MAG: L,D-transpeptidase family protein [Thermoanaerobaculia bacterium]|nr:L,D-transpeptidase family protein [Thermoanaerobaculia bacterium]